MANQCNPSGSGFGGGGFPGGINPSDVQGIQGLQGIPGPQGLPGPPGPSPGTTPLDPDCEPIGSAPTRHANGSVNFGEGGGTYNYVDIEIDYSEHIDKIICEFHQHNVTHIAILNELRRLADNSDIIKVHQGTIAAMTTKIAGHQESIAADTVRIRTVQEHMRVLADTIGITTRSPYEYLYTYSSLRSLELDNISVAEAINSFNGIPAQTLGSPGSGQTPQPTSPMIWEGTWDEKQTYKPDDIVYYGEQAWVAQRPNVGAPPADNKIWKPLTTEIVAETEKPKEVWKGTWNKNKNYPAGSIVMYKPGLEKENIDNLADLALSSIPGKIYKASENIGTYIQTQVLPSDASQPDGHTCWVEVSYCAEPDVCETTRLANVTILSGVGDISCSESKLARIEIDAPIIVEQKNKNFDMPDFVEMYKGTYITAVYRERAEVLLQYYITNNKYTISDAYDIDDFVAEFKDSNDPVVYKEKAQAIIPYYTSNNAYSTQKDYTIDDFVQEFRGSYAIGVYKARALAILPLYTTNNPFEVRKCYDMDAFVAEFRGSYTAVDYKTKAEAILPLYNTNDPFTVGGDTAEVTLNYKVTVASRQPPPQAFRPNNADPELTITASPTSVVEGNSVTFTVNTKNLADGTVLYWTNKGTTNSLDFTGSDSDILFNLRTTPANPPVFTVSGTTYRAGDILNKEGVWEQNINLGTFERNYAIDFPVDGTYTLTGSCDDNGFVYIDDVEVAQLSGHKSTVTKAIEVKAGIRRLRIVGQNFKGPGAIGVIIRGGVSANSGSFIVNNNTGSITVGVKNDGIPDSNETIQLDIRKDSLLGTIISSTPIVTVIDAPTTYNTIPKSTSVNEGNVKQLTLQSSNFWINNNREPAFIKVNDVLVLQAGGRGTTMAVFEPDTLTLTVKKTFDTHAGGSYTDEDGWSEHKAFIDELNAVPNGKLLALISFDALQITNEMRSVLNTKFGGTRTDTQIGVSANNRRSWIFLGYRGGNSIYEDISNSRVAPLVFNQNLNLSGGIDLNVTTTNVANGTTLYYDTSSPSDVLIASGSFVVQNGVGNVSIPIAIDNQIEGTESITVNIRTGSTSGPVVNTSDPIFINDTASSNPTYLITPISNNVNEGSSLQFNVSTTNVVNGTTLYYDTNLPYASSELGASSTGTVTISNNSGSLTISVIADSSTEGVETFAVRLRTDSSAGPIVATSSTVTIVDTSAGSGGGGGGGAPRDPPIGSVSMASVSFNPTIGPIQDIPGEYSTTIDTPIQITMNGGPPGAVITVTKKSNSDGMFGAGYVAGTPLTGTITLDGSGNYTDSTQIFPVGGIAEYTFKFNNSSNVTRTRYGLYRNPDREGLAYWTNQALGQNLDPTSIYFRTIFFKSVDEAKGVRHLTNDKTFDPTTASGCGFYDDPPGGAPTITRYGLYRWPNRQELSYWVNESLEKNYVINSTAFNTIFFNAAYYTLFNLRTTPANPPVFPLNAKEYPAGDILNKEGVWEEDIYIGAFERLYNINFPYSGNYVIIGACDDHGYVYIDGVEVANFPGFQSTFTQTIQVTAGVRSLRITAQNYLGPGAIGVIIKGGETRHITQQNVFDDTHAPNAPEFRDQPDNWAGPTRYGLFQYPDRTTLNVATDYAIANSLSPSSIEFRTAFFTYMDSLNKTRHLTQDKPFDNTNTGGGFYDAPPNWAGASRWALYRYPDHESLGYWTTRSLDKQLDPNGIAFRTEFFNGQTSIGETRHLTGNKIFDPTSNGAGFRQDPAGWNQGGSGNINGLTCAKTFKIASTNNVNIFKLVNEDGSNISTTIGNAANLTFHAEKKKPNPDLTEVEFKGCWEDCTIYKTHEMVLHNEVTWVATKDNTGNEPNYNSRYWRELTTEQAAFIDNPPIWKGAWTNNTTYPENSIVSYDNKSWIAKNYVDIITTPPPPDQAPNDWQIIDDPSIYCEMPEPVEEKKFTAEAPNSELIFTGPYDPERPYKSYDVVEDPDRIAFDPTSLKYAILPEFIDIEPIEAIVKDDLEPAEPSEWSPDEPYQVGDIVLFSPIEGDALPDRIPDYSYDPEALNPLVKPTDFVPPEKYVAVKPVEPAAIGPNGSPGTVGLPGPGGIGGPIDRNANSPKNNPDKWAKLVPQLGPPGTVYPKNSVVPVTVKPGNVPDNKKMYIAMEPTTKVPKANPNTGTNTRPRTVDIPLNPNTNQPAWAELVPNRNIPVEYGGPEGADPTVGPGGQNKFNPNGASIKGLPINSSYWRPARTNYKKEWEWRTSYLTGDIVSFCGVLYKAIDNSIGAVPPYNLGNLQETSTKWVVLDIGDLE